MKEMKLRTSVLLLGWNLTGGSCASMATSTGSGSEGSHNRGLTVAIARA